jgi:predicted nicotinamide N-methyase
LNTAIELDLFTAISEGNRTVKALAEKCQVSHRGVRILANFLTKIGFLEKKRDEYGLTLDSKIFCDRRSPAYLRETLAFLLSSPLIEGFNGLTQAVRKGGTSLEQEGTVTDDHPEWVTFARAMIPLMAGPAKWISQYVTQGKKSPMKVLDIAAGHGLFGIEIAKANPSAKIVAVDWPNVLALAEGNAKTAGVFDRYESMRGNAFQLDFGMGYDLVLLTNFLHHFDPETCENLLRKLYASLN